ncbi:MAG TPA: glycosyltransferase family 2 protein [Bacteroidia bacterium]
MEKKLISVVTPCYNEEGNVEELYKQVKAVFDAQSTYRYEHIFIDNCSKDRTVTILREIAKQDKNVKVILNARNFGYIRSPYYALLQAQGDAVVMMACDLQDPPPMIKDFIAKWEEGYKMVFGIKTQSEESFFVFQLRKLYYRMVNKLSDTELIKNFTGFGLYDQQVISILRKIDDPYPYFRGLVCDIGFDKALIEFKQPNRKRGISASNFYALYDLAMVGITKQSKVPLRLATMIGIAASFFSFLVAVAYFIYKLIFWNSFSLGTAPMVIGVFFFSAVQLFFIGVIGEYVGSIHTQVLKRPLVVEKERINFD